MVLSEVKQNRPSLILLDIMTPGINGWVRRLDAAALVRGHVRYLSVIPSIPGLLQNPQSCERLCLQWSRYRDSMDV